MRPGLKHHLFEFLDPTEQADPAERAFNVGMIILIVLNVAAVILGTEPGLSEEVVRVLQGFEVFSVAVFAVEYVLRVWVCTEYPKYSQPAWGRLRYMLSPAMLIDLLAILPFFIPATTLDLRVIRAVRLFRMFRLLKIGRYSEALSKLGYVLKRKRGELAVTFMSLLVLLIIASSLMYFVEHEAQPEAFGSILASMWWGAVTLTTVGYGDIYPTTALGKMLGAFIALLGIGLFAMPAGIIASGFLSEIEKAGREITLCPHCGKEIA
jgi:voltage-gated potassium channel